MKTKTSLRTVWATRLLPLLLFLMLPVAVQAQSYTNSYGIWTYTTTTNGTVTLTGYTGPGGAVEIPGTISSLPVTTIGGYSGGVDLILGAFEGSGLASVTIPNSVTNIAGLAFSLCTSLTNVMGGANVTSIGESAFAGCYSLNQVTLPNVTSIGTYAFADCYSLNQVTLPDSVTSVSDAVFLHCYSLGAITVGPLNSAYSSVDGVLYDKSQTTLIAYPAGRIGIYTIPDGVTSIAMAAFDSCTNLTGVIMPSSLRYIGQAAFEDCTHLASVTIPNRVTNIWDYAFYECTTLASVYFEGNAPSLGSEVFAGDNNTTVYYLAGPTGWWNPTFGGRPSVLWNPQVQTSDTGFGVRTNQFGFKITGTPNIIVVVEASTGLTNAIWTPLATNTLTTGSAYFSDPQWRNYPSRFYRLRWP